MILSKNHLPIMLIMRAVRRVFPLGHGRRAWRCQANVAAIAGEYAACRPQLA
jgi:hypothetical protein